MWTLTEIVGRLLCTSLSLSLSLLLHKSKLESEHLALAPFLANEFFAVKMNSLV